MAGCRPATDRAPHPRSDALVRRTRVVRQLLHEEIAQHIDEWHVRSGASVRIAAAEQKSDVEPGGTSAKLVQQPALSGPGLTDHHQRAALALRRRRELILQRAQLPRPARVRRETSAFRGVEPMVSPDAASTRCDPTVGPFRPGSSGPSSVSMNGATSR